MSKVIYMGKVFKPITALVLGFALLCLVPGQSQAAPIPIEDFAAFVLGNLGVGNNIVPSGMVTGGLSGSGANTTIFGMTEGVHVGGNLGIGSNVVPVGTVMGNAFVNGSVSNFGTITGTLTFGSAMIPTLPTPKGTPAFPNAGVTATFNPATLAPGLHDKLRVTMGTTTLRTPGTYNFNDIDVSGTGTLKIDSSAGPITITTTGGFTLQPGSPAIDLDATNQIDFLIGGTFGLGGTSLATPGQVTLSAGSSSNVYLETHFNATLFANWFGVLYSVGNSIGIGSPLATEVVLTGQVYAHDNLTIFGKVNLPASGPSNGVIPEPSTVLLLGTGLAGLVG